MSWREIARPIITQVLRETAGQDPKAIRRALREAYPFGQRGCYPYKAWLLEIKAQRERKAARRTRAAQLAAGQLDLFGE